MGIDISPLPLSRILNQTRVRGFLHTSAQGSRHMLLETFPQSVNCASMCLYGRAALDEIISRRDPLHGYIFFASLLPRRPTRHSNLRTHDQHCCPTRTERAQNTLRAPVARTRDTLSWVWRCTLPATARNWRHVSSNRREQDRTLRKDKQLIPAGHVRTSSSANATRPLRAHQLDVLCLRPRRHMSTANTCLARPVRPQCAAAIA